jgi:hypothetical protein
VKNGKGMGANEDMEKNISEASRSSRKMHVDAMQPCQIKCRYAHMHIFMHARIYVAAHTYI